MAGRQTEGRWAGRPGLSRALRVLAVVGPLLVGLLAAFGLSAVLPVPADLAGGVRNWVVLSTVATVVVLVVDRFARRLLPIAALLQLNLAFPDEAPSRYRVAREAASTRGLAEEVRQAREHGLSDDRTEAAASVLRLVSALSLHDKATRGHAERTRVLTDMIAAELDLPDDDIDRLRWASLVHDVGKIAVHPGILNKAGTPTEEEWAVLRQHPEEGARLTAPLTEWLGEWALTIEQHHERWDGGGYPHGLQGREIQLGARIVAVADAFDVMTAARAYRDAIPAHEAREELAACAGDQFDPIVVRAFLAIPASRLRAVVGPLSWLATVPMVRPLSRVPSSAAATAVAAVATAAAVAAGGLTVPALDADEPTLALEEPQADAVEPAPLAEPSPLPTPATQVLGIQEAREPGPEPLPVGPLSQPAGDDLPVLPPVPSTPRRPVTVTQNPTPQPPPPPARGTPQATDDVVRVEEDGTITFDVLANDTDPQGDPLSVLSIDRVGDSLGTYVDNGDGTITYTPGRDEHGTDELRYRVSDGRYTDTAVVRIDVQAVNDPPVASTDRYAVASPGTLQVAARDGLLANDADIEGDDLTVDLGMLKAPPASQGTVEVSRDGGFRFVPEAGFDGTVIFRYGVTDGVDATMGTVRIEVTATSTWLDDGLFLTGDGLGTTTSAMSATAPSNAGARIPDWDGDGAPGRTIEDSGQDEDEDDPRKFHDWLYTLDRDAELDGAVDLTITSAVADLQGDEDVDYTIYLYSCNANGTSCTRLASRHNKHVKDWNAEGRWSTRTIRVGTVSRTLQAGSTLRLKLLFHHEDVWLPLTGDLPTVLRFTEAT